MSRRRIGLETHGHLRYYISDVILHLKSEHAENAENTPTSSSAYRAPNAKGVSHVTGNTHCHDPAGRECGAE